VAARVRPARSVHAPSGPGAVAAPAARPRLGLRVREPLERGGRVRALPARQGGPSVRRRAHRDAARPRLPAQGGRRRVRRLSLRLRLTLAFSVVMALLLGLTGLVVYRIVSSDLNNAIDRSLKSRAAQLAASPVPRGEGDDFSQVLSRDGRVLAT